ncbi:MAG: glutamate 5-kinase [Lachnospiraceae bacterium]|nr:glutamate 5-kinase [Lachnospiraceae bacterium]MDY5741691.1 glutamate 5-kinase [Lachnospiraceae bacterium]
MSRRQILPKHKRIVLKIGTTSLTHPQTGALNLGKIEVLVRELVDLRNQGKEVVLVTSGAIGVGRRALGMKQKPDSISTKQACAAIGQSRLMMIYQQLFSEYNQVVGQILMTKSNVLEQESRTNVKNTFEKMLQLGVIPIVNENDSVSTFEMQFGDNDTLSAIVACLVEADALILLSDIDGLYSDDPNANPDARFISEVTEMTDQLRGMGKGSSTALGTGGMSTKLTAAHIAMQSGIDMVIANGGDAHIVGELMSGEPKGTLFVGGPKKRRYYVDYIKQMEN